MKEFTENELSELIRSWEGLTVVMQHTSEFPQHLEVLMHLAFDDRDQRNWRAAWMVDRIHEKHPELVVPYLPEMTDFVLVTTNSGKKRHLLKLISLHPVPEDRMVTLLDYCIAIFTDANEPVAVRVHAMQILYNIAQQEPGLGGELVELIENEIELHGSAGISSRGRKLLKKLYALKG